MNRSQALRTSAILAGCAATLAPVAARASGFATARVHSDLWFTLALFVMAALAEALARDGVRAASAAARLFGASALGVAGLNLPALWERAAAVDGAVARYIAATARVQIGWYALAALAGLTLALAPRGPAEAARS
jgi:hypothetical protein